MKIEEIEHGCYWLDEPMENPHPDRRSRDWSCLPELPRGRYLVTGMTTREEVSGMTFERVEFYVKKTDAMGGSIRVDILRSVQDDGSTNGEPESWSVRCSEHDGALLEALARSWRRDESPAADLIHAQSDRYVETLDVVSYLVECGALSQQTLRVAIAAVDDRQRAQAAAYETEREREQERRRHVEATDSAFDLLRRIRDGELADGDWREIDEVLDELETSDPV